jgi:hypothetical protein
VLVRLASSQWRHQRAIPEAAKWRLVNFFGQSFQIADELAGPTFRRPAGGTCLADLARKYIK